MTTPSFECTVLRTPDYLRVLEDEKKLTFAVTVGENESHHQIDITEYDTRDKIEARMAEIGAQVADEMIRGKNSMRSAPVPADIQALVDEAQLPPIEARAQREAEVAQTVQSEKDVTPASEG